MNLDSSMIIDPRDTVSDFELNQAEIPAGNLRAFTAVLLALLIIVTFLGNLLVLVTLCSSFHMRKSKFNWFLMNVSLVNLLDIIINAFVSLLYVAEGDWIFGKIFCRVNSATVELVGIMMVVGLMLMVVDRALALLDCQLYKTRMSSSRAGWTICLVWLLSLSVCLPISFGSPPSSFFFARYFCAVSPQSPLLFTFCFVCIYLCCSFVVLLCFGVIFYRAREDRLGHRRFLPPKTVDYPAFIREGRSFHDHLNLAKFAVVVYVVYFLLQGPYMFLNLGMQWLNSRSVVNEQLFQVPSDSETLLTWLKFVFPVTFPFLAFVFQTYLWDRLLLLFGYRRTFNSISAAGSLLSNSTNNRPTVPNGFPIGNNDKHCTNTGVMTLDGLHLHSNNRTVNEREQQSPRNFHLASLEPDETAISGKSPEKPESDRTSRTIFN